jgi:hypothetical protein
MSEARQNDENLETRKAVTRSSNNISRQIERRQGKKSTIDYIIFYVCLVVAISGTLYFADSRLKYDLIYIGLVWITCAAVWCWYVANRNKRIAREVEQAARR